jgi:hypothetical protein
VSLVTVDALLEECSFVVPAVMSSQMDAPEGSTLVDRATAQQLRTGVRRTAPSLGTQLHLSNM